MTTKTIPTTTAAACAKYDTKRYTCNCADFSVRGGSYFHARAGRHVCKHVAALLSGHVSADEIQATQSAITVGQVQTARAARFAPHFPTPAPATPARFDWLELEPTAEQLFARFA